jgi:tight adherence protein B
VSTVVAAAVVVIAAALVALPLGRGARWSRVVGPAPSGPWARPVWLSRPRELSVGAGVAAAGVAGWFGGPVAALAGGAYGVLAVRAVSRARQAAADARLRARALEAVCTLADEVRAGANAATALGVAVRAIARGPGGPVGAGTVAELRAVTHPALRDVAQALAAVCALLECGIPLVGLVDRLEAEIQAREDAARRTYAQLAGARAGAALLAVLPIPLVLVGQAAGGDPLRVLFASTIGGACVFAAIVLQVAGAWWSRRITSAVVGR